MSSFMVRWLKLSLVIVMGCGFLAMMIYALLNRDEISSSQIEPPLISPPSEPLKRRPDQPGGMQIPNRDKLVFDLLDSSNTTLGGTGVDSMREDTLEPIAEVVSPVAVTPAVEQAAPAAVAPVAPVAEPKVEVKPVEVVAPKVEVKPISTPAAKEPEKVVEKKAVEKPVEKAAEKPAAGGKWGVQLAAVNTVADGNALAAKAMKDFSALAGLSPKVSQVPGAGKYRVQLFGFKDRDAAAAACAKLAGKQGCFPVGGK